MPQLYYNTFVTISWMILSTLCLFVSTFLMLFQFLFRWRFVITLVTSAPHLFVSNFLMCNFLMLFKFFFRLLPVITLVTFVRECLSRVFSVPLPLTFCNHSGHMSTKFVREYSSRVVSVVLYLTFCNHIGHMSTKFVREYFSRVVPVVLSFNIDTNPDTNQIQIYH